jgi:hypothetical protein
MKSLIWKEWRENLKWFPLPGLVILLVTLINRPLTPMPDVTGAYFRCLIAAVFGAALGFLQIFFEAYGDQRSLLLHRPISRSRIFLAKVIAGVGLYVLALGVPFACLEIWLATPGKIAAPYHWRTSLPWLADILSGLVYYFAGMLVAQRNVRWYGSRGLALTAAFFCSYLVWNVPGFWQALLAIGIIGLFEGVAAWGNFCAGGAYAPQPPLARAALAMTLLTGLLILSMLGKQMIGEGFDSGIEYHYDLDSQGRVLFEASKPGVGQVGSVTYLNAEEGLDLTSGPRSHAPSAFMETPLLCSYRNSGRCYVPCSSRSIPGQESWYYDQTQRRLLGYDSMLHQSLGSFGPDGFTPPGQPLGERFQGELRYRSERWEAIGWEYLAFPGGIYSVDFYRRTIRSFFVPPAGETVTFADDWQDPLDWQQTGIVISTDKAFHFLTRGGLPLISVPRVFDREKHGYVHAGPLANPKRYYVWYQSLQTLLEPEEFRATPGYLLEYDVAGRELARRIVPPVPVPAASYAEALFGLVTPMTEAAAIVGASRQLRSEERLKGSTQKSVFLLSLENSQYYIPATSRYKGTPSGLIAAYLGLVLLSAAACATGCFLLARRYAFSTAHRIGWSLVGFFFGWAGLVLMIVLQDWPARVACPKCRIFRVVTREECEHCGALHIAPAPDGTEIFAENVAVPQPVRATHGLA